MTTISASRTLGLNLSSGSYTSPVYIDTGVSVTNKVGSSAISSSTGLFVIQNYGLVSGTSFGVYLKAGGSVINKAAGSIIATNSFTGIGISGAGAVANYGTILGEDGVLLGSNGTVTNATSALIAGYLAVSGGSSSTLVNDGRIVATGTGLTQAGVQMGAGSSVTNGASGSITSPGNDGGLLMVGGTETVVNDGTITAPNGDAVDMLSGGGSVTNAGLIYAWQGVFVQGATGTVVNRGSIVGTYGNGVLMITGGSVTNAASAWISAAGIAGINVGGAPGTVVNYGSVKDTGPNGNGVYLYAGGSVTNAASASITAGYTGVYVGGALGTVVNYGAIAGSTGFGVILDVGGSVTNAASALITAGKVGVEMDAGGTLMNAGTIAGSPWAVALLGTGSNRLVLDQGFGFSGQILGSATASNILELASAASVGTVTGLGAQFINFGSITFDAGEHWFIAGNSTGLAGTISGFAFGDTIEVTGFVETSYTFTGAGLVLGGTSGSATIGIQGTFATSDFNVSSTGGNTSIEVACFTAGTHISTEHGEIPVEELRIGDRARVLLNGPSQEVIWIGFRRVDCATLPKPELVWPVRISAGAFGPARPYRDLWLSPDHAIYVGQVLIPLKHLVNDMTISQVRCNEVQYYHVELLRHSVLLADGLAVESFLDATARSNFDNGGCAIARHPDFASRVWEGEACAPLVVAGPQLDAARLWIRSLADRASQPPKTAQLPRQPSLGRLSKKGLPRMAPEATENLVRAGAGRHHRHLAA